MDRDEALKLLTSGEEGIRAWNDHRARGGDIPSLEGANLAGANLTETDLTETDLFETDLFEANLTWADLTGANLIRARLIRADLTGANLSRANLTGVNLAGANFTKANLIEANLSRANLSRANLIEANLFEANLSRANLSRANLTGVNLFEANLIEANLAGANLTETDLTGANLTGANLSEADLGRARCGSTTFANLDLYRSQGLDQVVHYRPSTIGVDTLSRSKGGISEAFMRGCGLAPWEVLSASLYDPTLTPPQIVEIQYKIFDTLAKGKNMINGCFISYSWKDSNFVAKLRDHLMVEGVNVWLDKHDMVAGNIQDQVWRAIQLHHVVVLVLSKHSVKSDWVENELDMARRKEKAEGRAVLCPIALDNAWRAKLDASARPGDANRALWRTLETKLVLDFSPWKTKAFDGTFGKLVKGLKVNYGPKDPPTS